ncbi:TolB-like protein [Bradyrhizobium sp. GM2.4]
MTETAPAPSPSFTLALLGRFELIGPDGAVSLPNKKLAGLLAYLAYTAPQPQHREKLSTLLWGSHFEAQAKQNLRQALFKLRQVLGQSALRSDGEFISLNAVVITCDVPQFERLVRKGSRDALTAAADLYRGRLVDDIAVNAEGWSEWVAGERERLSELAVGAMVALGDQELSDGRAGDALLAGQRANALNSMREDAHRLIMRALSAAGRNAEALKYYQAVVAFLKQELGTAPDATTSALAAELRKVQEQKIVLPAADPTADLSHQAEHVFGNDRPSVAVLPFRNMGDETEQDYFADGVTADIITALSRFRELVVIAAGSSFALRDKGMTSRQIAQQLGAQYVLSGHIRKAGNRIRVSAELTHTGSEAQVWSNRYDRPLVDIFDLQDDVSSSVAAVVDPAVRSAEIERARRKPPTDLSAYDLYLRGLHHLWGGTREGIVKAIDLLRRSLSLDQERTATLAALAWGLVMAPPLGANMSADAASEAVGLARRAVEQDSGDAFRPRCLWLHAVWARRRQRSGAHSRQRSRKAQSEFGFRMGCTRNDRQHGRRLCQRTRMPASVSRPQPRGQHAPYVDDGTDRVLLCPRAVRGGRCLGAQVGSAQSEQRHRTSHARGQPGRGRPAGGSPRGHPGSRCGTKNDDPRSARHALFQAARGA